MSQRMWMWWAGVGLLGILSAALAMLQYQWIGEVADAERTHLKEDLQNRLDLIRRDFDARINVACASFIPANSLVQDLGREQAYREQYHRAIGAQEQLVRRIALALPRGDDLDLSIFDTEHNQFERVDWPPGWGALRMKLRARLRGGPVPSGQSAGTTLVELPRFGGGPGREGEDEWLVLELDTDYVRSNILSTIIANHLGNSEHLDYDTQVSVNGDPSISIYQSGLSDGRPFVGDAAVGLLDVNPGPTPNGRRQGTDPETKGPPPQGPPKGPPPPKGSEKFFDGQNKPGLLKGRGAPPPLGTSAWVLRVRLRAGSLEALVATTRRRNMGISAGILLLILATAGVLLHVSRESQRVAELQMNFVAGVSHELRTPLTIIRTAAFNLRKTFASNPDQVERYGELIQKESEKLGDLVEQVLRYGSAKAGSVIQQSQAVDVEALIESSLRASRIPAAGSALVVDKKIDPELPPVFGDEEALKHAIQNLLDNACKHGAAGHWIGIFAAVHPYPSPVVEIRVADRGPGIPSHEIARIFDPFFRGRRALEDQVHGTGLGLNLAKRIIEAHGGSIRVKSEPLQGTEFIVRLPAGSRKAAVT